MSLDPVRLASMIAAIRLGATLADARARGAVLSGEEAAAWRQLERDQAAIQAHGGDVDVPREWF